MPVPSKYPCMKQVKFSMLLQGVMVKFNVANESQPAAFKALYVYVPEVEYVVPFQVYVPHVVKLVTEDVA